jgi:phage baseplate assembly protein W
MNRLNTLPINFKSWMQGQSDVSELSLVDSIGNNCTLIITTRYNAHRFDREFGCIIWDKDFEILTNNIMLEEEVQNSIRESLVKYEKRLERINVTTTYSEDIVRKEKTRIFRKTITINIQAVIIATGQNFHYKKSIYLSPIELA